MAQCFWLLEDGIGKWLLEDGSGFFLLEKCEDDIVYGGGTYPRRAFDDSYYDRIQQYREERRLAELKLRQNEVEQRLREKDITRIEAEREEDLADRELQRRLMVGLKELEKLKTQHRELLLIIEFFKRDEDDITILLLSSVI
jgi:hypothetical protein